MSLEDFARHRLVEAVAAMTTLLRSPDFAREEIRSMRKLLGAALCAVHPQGFREIPDLHMVLIRDEAALLARRVVGALPENATDDDKALHAVRVDQLGAELVAVLCATFRSGRRTVYVPEMG